jgi:hypothetical protein
MGFWFKQILAGWWPLVHPFCQDYINFTAGCWSWMENRNWFPGVWPRFLYNARIFNVMARTRRDLGSSRFRLVEYLDVKRWYQLYSRLLVLDEKPQLISRCLTRFMYNARILNVMARTRRDLALSRFRLVEDLWVIIFAKIISSL